MFVIEGKPANSIWVDGKPIASAWVDGVQVYGSEPTPPEDFNWQARFNLSVDGGTDDVVAGFNTLRPTSPIAANTEWGNFVDTNGNPLTGITLTILDPNVVAETSSGSLTPDYKLYNHRWRNNGGYQMIFGGLDDSKRYTLQTLSKVEGSAEGSNLTSIIYRDSSSSDLDSLVSDGSTPPPIDYDFSDEGWVRHEALRPESGNVRLTVIKRSTGATGIVQAFILTEYDISIEGTQSLHVSGVTTSPLPYISYVPSNTSTPKPAFIFLHGSGERGNGSSTELPKVLKFGTNRQVSDGIFRQDAYAFSPQIPTSTWWDESGAITASFIDYIIGEYNIDPNKVYIIGFSDGATGVGAAITSTNGAKIAAGISMGYDPGKWVDRNESWWSEAMDMDIISQTPTWTFRNKYWTSSSGITWEDTLDGIDELNRLNPGIAKLTVFNDYDHTDPFKVLNETGMGPMVDSTYDPFDQDIYSWLLSHAL